MKVENEQKEHRQATAAADGGRTTEAPHHETRAERDEQIAAMQQRSKHQTHVIEPPPEIPPLLRVALCWWSGWPCWC